MKSAETPYPFVRQPRRIISEWRAGQIDDFDRFLLDELYSLLKPGSWVVRISLPRLAESIQWPYTDDALSKRLRKLRRCNWLRYAVTPGRHAPIYVIELWHEPGSEHGPSWDPHHSEDSEADSSETGPSRGLRGPSSATPPPPAVGPESEQSAATPVRAVKTFQETPVFDGGVNNKQRYGTKSAEGVQRVGPRPAPNDGPDGAESAEGRLFDPGASDRGYGWEPEG